MKRIIFVILFLFSVCYAEEYGPGDKIRFAISHVVVDFEKTLNAQGIKTDSIAWSGIDYVYPGSMASYPINLKKGMKCYFYTLSDGPALQTSIRPTDPEWHEHVFPGVSNLIISYYVAPITGEYHFYVRSCSSQRGIQNSYFTYIVREK